MSKTIYITDKDALDVDRVVVNSPDLKCCKIFISCDVCEVLRKAYMVTDEQMKENMNYHHLTEMVSETRNV